MTGVMVPLFEQAWPEGDYCFFQLGFVVEDLVDVARRWTTVFGVGPFHILPRSTARYVYRGAASSIELQVGVAQAGPVQIELIQQHCDSPSIFLDHQGSGRSALHQLCTVTEAYEAKCSQFQELGYDIVTELQSPGHRVAYVDTVNDFGFYTEIVEGSVSFIGHVSAIANTCARWDGTDPVRLLRRGGYDAL